MSPVSVLEGLLDDSVVTVEVDLFRDALDDLLPEEAAAIPKARPERRLEFRAGRHCARIALNRLGAARTPLLPAGDRSPIWPPGFVGSITHTRRQRPDRGWCAAAVAPSRAARGVGIDGELDEPLERKLWGRVLLPREQSWIETHPESEHGFWGKLLFCAKEATYKCQYPTTSQFLEFADVEVTIRPETASFTAVLMRSADSLPRGHEFVGRYARRNGIIASAVILP